MATFRPSPRSFPRTRLPHLLNVVRACPSAAPKGPVVLGAATTANGGPSASRYLYVDDQILIVEDAYPKSTVHLLVMPRDPTLQSLNDLTPRHLPLLRHMIDTASGFTERVLKPQQELFRRLRYISGFHAIPSLPMLHLHHVSMDLESDRLKNKKHYNTFATYFFLPAEQVYADLAEHGHVTVNQATDQLDGFEHGEMKCLWCGLPLANIPAMKSHVPSCPKNAAWVSRGAQKLAKAATSRDSVIPLASVCPQEIPPCCTVNLEAEFCSDRSSPAFV